MGKRRRSGGGWALAVGATLGTAFGCSEQTTGPTTADFEKAREESAQVAKAAAQPPAPVAPVEPAVMQVGGVEQIARSYTYDPTGKRDPFRSFVWERPDKLLQVAEAGPLGQFDLSQLEVVAVVWRTGNARALVEDPSGDTYIIAEGAQIGKNQGRVLTIDDNSVVVKEIYVDYLGQETTKDVEMTMRRNEGG